MNRTKGINSPREFCVIDAMFRPETDISYPDQQQSYLEVFMTKIFLSLTLALSVFLSFACVDKSGTKTAGPAGDTIKVGVYGDLTGQTSSFGQSTKNGIELAVDEINNAGGVNGKKIQLVVEDDQGRPEQAKTVVSKLINQDKVQAVLGEVASTNSLAAAPVAQEAKIPMI